MTSVFASADLDVFEISVGVLGGLALFLFGMSQMTDALKKVAGNGMRTLLAKLTKNRFMGAISGAVVTAICQSSSVTTVLLVGFISAGLMSLQQAIGVIMGANIGSTVTAQLIAFQITKLALPMVTVGFAFSFLARREKLQQVGEMIMGLGLVFYGMYLMSQATYPLREYQPFIDTMQRMDNPILAIVASAVITAIIQSSAATTGIVIVLAGQGYISLEAGIALALGSNIGTCVTAVLAAVGKPAAARQAAAAHVLFNIIGVMIWTPFIPDLSEFVQRLATETPRQIANAHTAFNVANTVLFIWFTGPIARLVAWLIREKKEPADERVCPQYLDASYLATPALALDRVQLEIGHLGQHVVQMIHEAPMAVAQGRRHDLMRVSDMDEDVDTLYAAILDYVRRLGGRELSDNEARRMADLLAIADYLESTGDLIETNLVAQGLQRIDHNLEFSKEFGEITRPLYESVSQALQDALTALANEDRELAGQVVAIKPKIQSLADNAQAHVADRLLADAPNRVKVFRVESDVIGQINRLYYYAKRIAKVIAGQDPERNVRDAA